MFVGKLTTWSGEPIHNATILIKNDQSCPEDQIIGSGITDKTGRFNVYTISKVWNEESNIVRFYAVFNNDDQFSASISKSIIHVIYPTFAEKCEI